MDALLRITCESGQARVTFMRPDLRPADADALASELRAVRREADLRCILLDFDGFRYLPSAILGTLLEFHQWTAQSGVELRLVNMSPKLREVFTVSDLHRVFDIRDDGGSPLSD